MNGVPAQRKSFAPSVADATNGVTSRTPTGLVSATAAQAAHTAPQLDIVRITLLINVCSPQPSTNCVSFSPRTQRLPTPTRSPKTRGKQRATTRISSHHYLPTRPLGRARRPMTASATSLRISPSTVPIRRCPLAILGWAVWTLTTRRSKSSRVNEHQFSTRCVGSSLATMTTTLVWIISNCRLGARHREVASPTLLMAVLLWDREGEKAGYRTAALDAPDLPCLWGPSPRSPRGTTLHSRQPQRTRHCRQTRTMC